MYEYSPPPPIIVLPAPLAIYIFDIAMLFTAHEKLQTKNVCYAGKNIHASFCFDFKMANL